jgi:hypothetical protein
MLLIVSIKIMILHTDRLLPTWRVFKLLPLTGGGEICHSGGGEICHSGGGEICHREKLFRRNYNARL